MVAQLSSSKVGDVARSAYSGLLMWAVIALGAYMGTLIRMGFQYYRGGGPSPAQFTVAYANMLGSFILGLAAPWQHMLTGPSAPLLHRAFYTFVSVSC